MIHPLPQMIYYQILKIRLLMPSRERIKSIKLILKFKLTRNRMTSINSKDSNLSRISLKRRYLVHRNRTLESKKVKTKKSQLKRRNSRAGS